jgi:hypothetical protein
MTIQAEGHVIGHIRSVIRAGISWRLIDAAFINTVVWCLIDPIAELSDIVTHPFTRIVAPPGVCRACALVMRRASDGGVKLLLFNNNRNTALSGMRGMARHTGIGIRTESPAIGIVADQISDGAQVVLWCAVIKLLFYCIAFRQRGPAAKIHGIGIVVYLLGVNRVAVTPNAQQIILAYPIVAKQAMVIYTTNRGVKAFMAVGTVSCCIPCARAMDPVWRVAHGRIGINASSSHASRAEQAHEYTNNDQNRRVHKSPIDTFS